MKDSGKGGVGLKPGKSWGGSSGQGRSARQESWTLSLAGSPVFEGVCGGGMQSSQSNSFQVNSVLMWPPTLHHVSGKVVWGHRGQLSGRAW